MKVKAKRHRVPVTGSLKTANSVLNAINRIGVRMPAKHLWLCAYANLREQGYYIKCLSGFGQPGYFVQFSRWRGNDDIVVRDGYGFDDQTGHATETANETFFKPGEYRKAARHIIEVVDRHYFTNRAQIRRRAATPETTGTAVRKV